MIAHLSGRVFDIGDDSVIIDVGGVGYILYCSARTLANLPAAGEAVSVHVETQFKAESLTLYGFEASAERAWFRLLQTVQGVGARVALALLSALTPDQLAHAITAKDKSAFTQANGVGPRLAQRLISELQGKVGDLPTSPGLTLPGLAAVADKAATGPLEDAASALVNLGYGRSEAHVAVSKAVAGLGDGVDVETLIRAGLRELTAPLQGGAKS
ncbi:MAG: Holliday junction branch migration protein RuvA [Pseudomonadota bacterium]